MTSERGADVPRKDQCAARRAILEQAATAAPGVLGIRILWKIPIRVEHLQQVMEHVTGDHRAVAGDIELEHEVSGRVAWGGHDFYELVETVGSGDKIGAPRLDDRQYALAKCSEFRRSGGRVVIELLKVIKIRL